MDMTPPQRPPTPAAARPQPEIPLSPFATDDVLFGFFPVVQFPRDTA